MKEKIFKLLNTDPTCLDNPDFQIGWEFFLANYSDFLKEKGEEGEEDVTGNLTIGLTKEQLEEFFGDKFNTKTNWCGLYWYQKDL